MSTFEIKDRTVSPVAPRTPKTDKVYDCVNDKMKEVKLSLQVAETNLTLARSEYDLTLDELAKREGEILKQEQKVGEADLEVTFLETQKIYAINKSPELQAVYEQAQAEVDKCLKQPDECTVTGKGIKMQFANTALQRMLDNESEIARYQSRINEKKKESLEMQGILDNNRSVNQSGVQSAQQKVTLAQTSYVEKRENKKRLQKEYDELDINCKFQAFHDNQVQLTELRQDLARWGIRTSGVATQTVWQEQQARITHSHSHSHSGSGSVASYEKWDCRYKQFKGCQGENFMFLSKENKKQCRKMIEPVCFEKTYETHWFLDFMNAVLIPWAALACIAEDRFSYSLCMGNYAYVELLTNAYNMGLEY